MNVNIISSIDKLRKPITYLSNPSKLLPVILLETTVTGGRSIQAYKRGGKTELRERFTEDAVSAVFWLGGATALNKVGDKIGEQFFNIPKNFDGGADALRTPIKNTAKAVLDKAQKAATPENIKQMEKKLATFKFSKIALSTLISTAFVGFVLPKLNHALTRRMIEKENIKKSHQISITNQSQPVVHVPMSSKLSKPSFKGVNPTKLANLAHNLENHAIFKLASSDVGILTGRTLNARNEDDRREVLFRDITSSYFYTINPIVTRKILTNVVPNGKLATVNSDTAQSVLGEFRRVLQENGGKISADKFKDVMLGTLDGAKKTAVDALPFSKDGVISLDALKGAVKDSGIIERATQMAGLQPEHAELGKVLTRRQVEDVFRNGAITDFGSMFRMHKAQFGDALTDPTRFVPMKHVNKFRDSITTFVEETVKCAKDGQITEEVLKKVDRKNLIRTGAFWAAGFLISALFLSTIIPKAQYWLTEKRTGKNEFPGLHDKKLHTQA